MPENPIVVFFRQIRTSCCLPIAFSQAGIRFNPTDPGGDASLIVMDDDMAVPILLHTNINRADPLGVIWHKVTDDKKKALEDYGKPTRVDAFIHEEGNRIFDLIKEILERSGDVRLFVEEARKALVQFEMDELAALITYMALRPEVDQNYEDAYVRCNAILGRCTSDIQQLISASIEKKEYLSAVRELESIAGRAA